jgi:sigma-B regulation protein RsbU (phosphoserine phosphatase)
LVAFTDGISEAMNLQDEEWGEARLIQTIEGCNGLSPKEIMNHVFTAADTFVAGAKQHDDMTLVMLRVK